MPRSILFVPAMLMTAVLLSVAAHAQSFKVTRHSIGGDGGTDYLLAEPGSDRVFVSRANHVMVINGATGMVIGDIPDTPRVHGIALVPNWHHGFITNGGDSTVTMFDLATLAVIKQIKMVSGGLDGIMYDDFSDRIILTNHSRPTGTVTAINPDSGALIATAELEDDSPEGAASDGKGRIFINNESKHTIQVLDVSTMQVLASWPLAPCEGPTGIVYDRQSNRIIAGCSRISVVVDPASGKVVATIVNGDGVDALAWDPAEKLIYIPGGRDGNVTIVREDSPNNYITVATVATMPGAKTITVDPVKHVAYLFQPEYGPAPVPTAPLAPGTRPPRGPVIGAYFFVISH
jgi:DNA-binding beta-propeller fold protein YncE